MKKIFSVLPIVISLLGCDVKDSVKSNDGYTPEYVSDAKNDLENAIVANINKNPDFKCNSLMLSQQVYWSIACFVPGPNPVPFLLFEVHSDPSESNPPFKYKLVAINGKAKQYSENVNLRFINIDTKSTSNINIDLAIKEYIEAYPPK